MGLSIGFVAVVVWGKEQSETGRTPKRGVDWVFGCLQTVFVVERCADVRLTCDWLEIELLIAG